MGCMLGLVADGSMADELGFMLWDDNVYCMGWQS